MIPPLANPKQAILKAVSHEVRRPEISRKYVIGLIVTSIAVLLIPLVYLAMIAVACGALFGFLCHAETLFAGAQPLAKICGIGGTVVLVLPLILALLKPLVARPSAIRRPHTVRRHEEPLLFEYVDCLCQSLGAPSPTEIHLTCEVNAGAEFRGGWLSLLNRRDLSLHLGMPLVAGLTLPEFTGILAHELGHFTQRTAMRLENLIRQINRWFFRAASEEDSIDQWLSSHTRRLSLWFVPCILGQWMIWLTRTTVSSP